MCFKTNRNIKWSVYCQYGQYSLTFRALALRQRETDEGPMLETLDYTIRIGSTPTILYFDLYLYSAYAAHYVCFKTVRKDTIRPSKRLRCFVHLLPLETMRDTTISSTVHFFKCERVVNSQSISNANDVYRLCRRLSTSKILRQFKKDKGSFGRPMVR